ncbi:MAG: hypothetical protein ACREUT_09035, partial [Steroidobacteraceae bacterium]
MTRRAFLASTSAASGALIGDAALAASSTAASGSAPFDIGRGDRYSGVPWATRSPVLAQHGMIA